MGTLKNKIDFAVVFGVKRANPNGDPLNGNRPRVNYEGIGEVSDVCLKRKIRNRLQDLGEKIFVQSDDRRTDDYTCLRKRQEGKIKAKPEEKKLFIKEVCAKWIDVRAFGQVFAFKAKGKGKNKGGNEEEAGTDEGSSSVSIGIRGPVTIQPAFSVVTVRDKSDSQQITKSVSYEEEKGGKKGSDTMGMKHRVDHGVYVCYGGMNPQLANEFNGTGFKEEDAELIKKSLRSLFQNDESSARPLGTMEILKVIWWPHNCPCGQYSSAQVHRSLKVTPKDGITEPKNYGDYDIKVNEGETSGLKPEILDGIVAEK